jgi:hypothetical protein
MSFVAKTAPVDLDAHNRCVVIAPPVGAAAPTVGDVIYLWFSETQGGSGLAHRGEIVAVGDSVPLEIAVQVNGTCALSLLTKSHLQTFAKAPAGSGERGLWAKLYGHAHNKVVALDPIEASLLDAHFPKEDQAAAPIVPTAPKPEADLAKEFEAAMREIYNRAVSECRYHPTYFLQMVNERGGVGAAHALIAGKPSDGFTKLWELGRLDLSVEAMVLDKRWRSLFSDVERGVAHRRLRSAGYEAEQSNSPE